MSHLSWGTFALQDVVAKNSGVSPFGNANVKYSGSSDDAKLNATIPRFQADPQAVARFAADVDYQGKFAVPVVSGHGIGDSTVMVEGQSVLRQKMTASGKADQLVQVFVNSSEHSYWGDAHYPPLFEALLNWVEKGQKPTPTSISDRCKQLSSTNTADCKFQTDYVVKPIASRIFPR